MSRKQIIIATAIAVVVAVILPIDLLGLMYILTPVIFIGVKYVT